MEDSNVKEITGQSNIKAKNSNVDYISYSDTSSALTFSLENSKTGQIRHFCTGNLSIVANGNNQIEHIIMSAPYGHKGGNLYLKGTGTITSAWSDNEYPASYFLEQDAWAWDDNYNRELANLGDIFIEGVTINIHNAAGIQSCNSNVTIRNAVLKINDRAPGKRGYGITTGMADGNGAHRGLLTIENSEIEIKKCTLGLAWNKINMTGCNLYLGESASEYRINPAKSASYDDYGSFKRGYYENINYLKITKENLNLPSAYAIVKEENPTEAGYITLPEFAIAGKKVNVQVHCYNPYILSKLYVNGTAISGTSFTMPNKDTKVKAVFVKKKVTVNKISISGMSKKIAYGKKIALKATVSPSNASNKKVTWKSSNKKYATVNSKGVVTMKKAGRGKTVTITATAADGSKKKATYKIKCMKGAVKKVTISGKSKRTLKAGKSLKLKTSVKTTVKSSKDVNKTLKWTSSNKKYATVNSKGQVKALKKGKGKTVKITAAATDGSGKKATVTITLK